jgi:hypothetical protein
LVISRSRSINWNTELETLVEKVWLKRYPPSVPADINPDEYASLVEVFEQSCQATACPSPTSAKSCGANCADEFRQNQPLCAIPP